MISKQMADEQLAKTQIATSERNVGVLERSLADEKQKLKSFAGTKSSEKEVNQIQHEF